MNELIIKPSAPFNGFVNYFTKKSSVFKYLSAEGQKYSNDWADAVSVINYSIACSTSNCQWASLDNIEKSFIVFSFECPILITHYTLKTRTDADSENFPVSWTVECIDDGDVWKTIDTETDRKELNATGSFHTYKCDRFIMYAKKIRITCKKTASIRSVFHLSRVEFFGRMNVDECEFPYSIKKRLTCNQERKSSLLITALTLIYVSR